MNYVYTNSCPMPTAAGRECGHPIPDTAFCCKKHFLKLPWYVRSEAVEAFARYQRDEISVTDLNDVQARLLRKVLGEDIYPARPLVTGVGPDGAELVFGDDMTPYCLATGLVKNADNVFVVVGGVVRPISPTDPDNYARFVKYQTPLMGAAA